MGMPLCGRAVLWGSCGVGEFGVEELQCGGVAVLESCCVIFHIFQIIFEVFDNQFWQKRFLQRLAKLGKIK